MKPKSAFQHLERFIVRRAFVQAHRPFNRFHRVELELSAANVSRAAINFVQPFDPATGVVFNTEREAENLETASFVQPSIALVAMHNEPEIEDFRGASLLD